jgi:antitoxin component YwqK of YwqJK toxin-antitoxin module
MNRIFFLLIFLISCSQNESTQATVSTPLSSGLPPGAVLEEYNDETGLSKVLVKDDAGSLLQEGILRDGKREGNWIEYHPGGFVKSITPYVNDLKEGTYIEIGTNNQLTKKINYHKDLKHGEYKEYLYSTLKEERNYQNDKIEGITKVYYDIGKLMEEGSYKNGTRDGVSKWYDQEGKETFQYEYKEGQLVKK